MDFLSLINKLKPKLLRLATVLNDQTVNPDLRRESYRSVLQTLGQAVYDKVYDMTSWDFEINETLSTIFDRDIAAGLARNLSDAIATGDPVPADAQLPTYLNKATATAQYDATMMALQLGKHPVLRIQLRGVGDCDWCRRRAARSPIYNPSPSDFARHKDCNCLLKAEGYQSRNGEVKNYRPSSST